MNVDAQRSFSGTRPVAPQHAFDLPAFSLESLDEADRHALSQRIIASENVVRAMLKRRGILQSAEAITCRAKPLVHAVPSLSCRVGGHPFVSLGGRLL